MRIWEYTVLALGVSLMVEGHILGERTTGIATLVGLMGMFMISTYSSFKMVQKAKTSSNET